ncbi:MAG TPA: hypothetical protein VMW73_07780 [Spirochaetia bacterium]|nr:hypothetical protein [Spirochaetia bacterium]
MKMSPEYTKAQANMQAGVITSDGFLGDDHRNISDIIEQDEELMTSIGLDWAEVAARMHLLLKRGREGLGEPVTIDGKWIVQVSEARGFLASPFEDGVFRKINASVRSAQDHDSAAESLYYSELSLHLLEKYHFLQGKGSPFRVEPALMKRVLKL